MSKTLQALAIVLVIPTLALAASRKWTDQSGQSLKAEFMGVKDGRVVLKQGVQRLYHPLADFSLEDRDYIVERLKAKKQLSLLQELMEFANKQQAAPAAGATSGTTPGGAVAAGTGTNPAAAGEAKKCYGIDVPSLGLVVDVPDRAWTDLTGREVTASFEQVVAPGHVRLKPSFGLARNFALVNFSAADIKYIKDTLKADLEHEVFPPGELVPITAEQMAKGYRTWTDRKGVQLNGKFVSGSGQDIKLEVNDETRTYRLAGFSTEDRKWIEGELRRLAEEARRKREAAAAARNGGGGAAGRSPFGRSPFGNPGSRFPRAGGSMPRIGPPQYTLRCTNCGKSWNSSSPIGRCPDCADQYRFHCSRCGHTWTRKNQLLDSCPQCAARRNDAADNRTAQRNTTPNPAPRTPQFRVPTIPQPAAAPAVNTSDDSSSAMTIVVLVGGLIAIGVAVGVTIKLVGN